MPEKRLHRTEWRTDCIEQSRVRMTQPVPADALKPQLFAGGVELPSAQVVSVEWTAIPCSKDQSFRIRDSGLPCCQNAKRCRPERDRPLTALSFRRIKVAVINSLGHSQYTVLQIDVLPA